MEALVITIVANSLIAIGTSLSAYLVQRRNKNKLKAEFKVINEKIDHYEQEIVASRNLNLNVYNAQSREPIEENIPTPSEKGYVQIAPKNNYYTR